MTPTPRASSGIPGLDDILSRGESVLYVTLSETVEGSSGRCGWPRSRARCAAPCARAAASTKAALETFADFPPAAVLLDLGMPGMDGYEVARRIRALKDADGTVLIALTGWGQDTDRHRSSAAGFQHHLVKPADIAALQTLLGGLR